MLRNSSVSTAIGEYLVLGEILKRVMDAYLAHGDTQKGWDIVIFCDDKKRKVQVKTISRPTHSAVNGNFLGFDFLVVVLLDDLKPRSRFLVFKKREIESVLSSSNKDRKDKKRTMTVSEPFLKQHKHSEDAWDKFVL